MSVVRDVLDVVAAGAPAVVIGADGIIETELDGLAVAIAHAGGTAAVVVIDSA